MAIYRGEGGAGDSNTDATITAVTEQATIATTKASEAATSASNAATSETNAATSAATATTKASEASTSASNAATSETNAAASYDDFDDRYLGAKSSAPSTDNDGDALVTGALYFDTSSNVMKVWSGSEWLAAYASLSDALVATNNLSDLNNAGTARTNLGLGTAATTASTDYATAAQGTKVDGIEASADVTDTANVTAAGALMDSELTSEASVKALNQGVATTDSPTFTAINVNGLVTSDDLQIDLGTTIATAQITTPSILSGFQSFVIKNTHTEGYLTFGTTLGQARIQALGSLGSADPLKIDVGSTTAIHIDATGVVRLRQGITENKIDLVGTTTTINLNLATNFVHDLTGNTTYTFSNPAVAGEASAFTLKIIQGSTARTITWPSSVDWAGGTAPTLSTANNAVDIFTFFTLDNGTTYYGFAAGQAMA